MRTDLRVLVALGAVAVGAGVLAPPAGAQQVRVVERHTLRNDSLLDRILTADVGEVKRVVTTWRERESQLMRELRASGRDDRSTRRRLEEQLALHARDGFAIMSAIQARCIEERVPRPAGYLGLNLTNVWNVEGERPVPLGTTVTSIEPGSPAERAGVQRNDKVLSLGGLDARERTPDVSGLLVPGRNMVVRIERGGVARDVTIAVAKRPEGFGESCGEFERALIPMRIPGPGRIIVSEPGTGTGRVLVETREAEPRRDPAREQGPEMRFFIFGPGAENKTSVGFFAGAEFRMLDADWGEVLGVKQGVIVNEVANGSVCAQAGLKGGDVVTAVGRTPVASPAMLVQMLGAMDGTEATLSVVRGRDRKTVTLKWGPR
jgi:C-terminal processing protease CtpA/Prc